MKRTVILSGAAALGLLSASGLAQDSRQNWPTLAEAGWHEIVQCARIGSAEQRHECIDDVIRRAGLLDSAREEQAARQEFGDDTPAKRRAPERDTGRAVAQPASPPQVTEAPPARPSETPAASSSALARPERLQTIVRAAQLSGGRRLLVVTEEGSVWEQTQSEDLRVVPKPGDSFEVERGALGSYRCKFERSSIYRCRRTN